MAKKTFNVHVVLEGKGADYRDYMDGERVSSDGRELRSNDVMQTDMVEAKSRVEAQRIMSQKYPGRVVHIITLT